MPWNLLPWCSLENSSVSEFIWFQYVLALQISELFFDLLIPMLSYGCIWFQGRNLVVRLAENQKPKMVQAQLPPALVPITIPVPAGYVQSGKTHVAGTVPISYPAYPQAIAAYPTAAYPSATPHYQPQPQMQHAQVAVKNDPTGLPAGAPMGLRYPYVYQSKN